MGSSWPSSPSSRPCNFILRMMRMWCRAQTLQSTCGDVTVEQGVGACELLDGAFLLRVASEGRPEAVAVPVDDVVPPEFRDRLVCGLYNDELELHLRPSVSTGRRDQEFSARRLASSAAVTALSSGATVVFGIGKIGQPTASRHAWTRKQDLPSSAADGGGPLAMSRTTPCSMSAAETASMVRGWDDARSPNIPRRASRSSSSNPPTPPPLRLTAKREQARSPAEAV